MSRCGNWALRISATVLVGSQQNVTIVTETKTITDIRYANNVVFTGGPRYEDISRETAQPIRRLKLDTRQDIAFDRSNPHPEAFRESVKGDTLSVAAPRIDPAAQATAPKVARTIDKLQANHGWKGVANAEQLRTQLHRDAPKPPSGLPEQPRFEKPTGTASAGRTPGNTPPANGAAGRETAAGANGQPGNTNAGSQPNRNNPAVNMPAENWRRKMALPHAAKTLGRRAL